MITHFCPVEEILQLGNVKSYWGFFCPGDDLVGTHITTDDLSAMVDPDRTNCDGHAGACLALGVKERKVLQTSAALVRDIELFANPTDAGTTLGMGDLLDGIAAKVGPLVNLTLTSGGTVWHNSTSSLMIDGATRHFKFYLAERNVDGVIRTFGLGLEASSSDPTSGYTLALTGTNLSAKVPVVKVTAPSGQFWNAPFIREA